MSNSSSKTTTDMGVNGKMFFTADQWQELERQTEIYKYLMASIPVPPQLLLPLSLQSNRVSTGLRFSNGSDPEPWRCRRTDGKKWRCSKDVAPDLKYCERHAHKTRSRSRKHVETQSHNTTTTTKDNPIFSTAPPSNQHTSEWYMKNGAIPVSQSNIQFQHNSIGRGTTASARRQDFINDWSRTGSIDNCSLTLSMQSGGNGVDLEDQWLNRGLWVGSGSTPGGPLGEALCLGSGNMAQYEPSHHGYSSSMTTSSSCEGGCDQFHGFGLFR